MIGHIRDKGGSATSKSFSIEFNLTESVQEFVTPKAGLYKLEVWGGQGGDSYVDANYQDVGGLGGYSVGYKYFDKDTALYICVGGGALKATKTITAGGYNGGGNGSQGDAGYAASGGGGGATHVALINGTLKEIGYTEFVTNGKGLIVAGGGGGSFSIHHDIDSTYKYRGAWYGGAGGGFSGGENEGYSKPTVGTQTSAGTNGGFGYGANGSSANSGNAGAGGGFYGGGITGQWCAGSGGSGWIAGVPSILYKGVSYSPSTENGVNEGNGKAIITFITS